MAGQSSKHAGSVVEQFKLIIGEETANQIDPEHFAELALMIESAVDTAVLMRVERISESMTALADRIRHDAET